MGTQKRKHGSSAPRGGPSKVGPAVVAAFSANLSRWRRDKGLPLKAIAMDLGVVVSLVCEWEHGKRLPSKRCLDALSVCMGIPVAKLLSPDGVQGTS